MVAPFFSIVAAILEVKVDKILAFTPLPSPSESTAIYPSSVGTTSTLSPHSSSPNLFMLL